MSRLSIASAGWGCDDAARRSGREAGAGAGAAKRDEEDEEDEEDEDEDEADAAAAAGLPAPALTKATPLCFELIWRVIQKRHW
jgi:hypothetical protein